MGKFVESGGANALINAGSNVATALINQAFAEKNRERNYYWNEKAAENADQRQRAQYEDYYSPQAMLNQYQAAGLSPSLMMSGSGSVGQAQGGTGGAQGAGVAGLQGPYMSPIDLSQIELNKALARKANSEAGVTEETGKELALSQIAHNFAKAGKHKAETEVLGIHKELKAIELKYADDLASANLDYAIYKSENMLYSSILVMEQATAQELKNKLDKETYGQRVKQIYLENAKIVSDMSLNNSKIKLNETQIQTMLMQIAINAYNADTQRLSYQAQKKYYENQVEQWMKENGFREEELHNEDVRNWTQFAANVFGSICNLAISFFATGVNAAINLPI